MKKTMVVLAGVLAGVGSSWGMADNLIQLNNTIGYQYQDNYYNTPTNKTGTGVITETPELIANLIRENTYFGLHYRPSIVWYLNPSIETRETLQHELDANLNQTLSKRLSYTVAEAFRYGEQPQLRDRGNASEYPNQSFFENTLNGNVDFQLRESTRLDVSGRYYLLHYTDEAVATNNNYSILSAGATLRQDVSKATTISGSLNYDNTAYGQYAARSANTVSIGAGVDHTFGPRLMGSISGGYQAKSFTLSTINGQNSPYGNASLTYLFDPRLRLSAGASYSLWEADISTYASQERLTAFATLAYDITARLSFYFSGAATHGKYLAEQQVVLGGPLVNLGGADDIYQGSATFSYQLDRHNWLDLGYTLTDVTSDVRPDFTQNSYNADWRISF